MILLNDGDNQDGIEGVVGEPSGTDENLNEPGNDLSASPSGEPSGEGSEGAGEPVKDAAFWEKQYKEIQSLSDKRYNEYTTLKKSIEGFEQFGGPEQVLQLAKQLSADQEFSKWVQSRDSKKYGLDTDGMDEQQREAIQLVEKIAEEIAERKIAGIVKSQVDPLVEKNLRAHVDGIFGEMDKKHSNWREVQPAMEQLVKKMSPEVARNPSMEDIEGLYMMALVKEGKMNEFAAAQYKKQLETKKRNSSDAPPTSRGATDDSPAKTLAEAFKKAKASQGITGNVRLS